MTGDITVDLVEPSPIEIEFPSSEITIDLIDSTTIDIGFPTQDPSISIDFIESTPIEIEFPIKGQSGDGDKNYEQTFLTSSSVLVTHNLNKRPAVTVIDSADTEIICGINHIDDDTLTLTFTSAFSGVVICN